MQFEIVISNATDLLRVSANDIMCIEADGNYSTITLNDGEKHLVLFQLGQLAHDITDQLGYDSGIFARIGRSIIINQDYIHAISVPRQQLVLRAPSGFKVTLRPSRESLRQLKDCVESKVRKGGNYE